MKKISVMEIKDGDGSQPVRMIVMDNEVFDWGLDPDSISSARKTMEQNPDIRESVVSSIVGHFLDCFADFCGREITLEEVLEALKKGEIE